MHAQAPLSARGGGRGEGEGGSAKRRCRGVLVRMPSSPLSRRRWLKSSLGAGTALWLPEGLRAADQGLRIAPFRFDVTPPENHPLCGGWITPVKTVADSLEAIGFVLLGAGDPIVICAVDWTGILNRAHVEWRTALAKAAGTTPERV